MDEVGRSARLRQPLASRSGGASHRLRERIILFHTHPSGDPAPSPEDLAFTRRMVSAGELLGIRLLDHMNIGDSGR